MTMIMIMMTIVNNDDDDENDDDENLISLWQSRILISSSGGFYDCERCDHQHYDRDVLPIPGRIVDRDFVNYVNDKFDDNEMLRKRQLG